jgi:hypothetical protein
LMGNGMPPKPWSRAKLDLRVMQCIREYVDVALVLYRNDDDDLEATLREGGEGDVWRLIQKVIDEAGWQVCRPATQTCLRARTKALS